MRLRRTAAGAGIVALALAGCSSSGGGSTASSLPEPTTTTAVAVTTTTSDPPPTTTLASTTTSTTTVVVDATTADPKVLAQQLQQVLDRYEALIMQSRSDPNAPFTDEQLISDLREVATVEHLGLFWIPKWQADQADGTAVSSSDNGHRGLLLTSIAAIRGDAVTGSYCYFDDAITYRVSDRTIVNDAVALNYGSVDLINEAGHWLVADVRRTSTAQAEPTSTSPCLAQALAP
jgi:hypothetical protein